MFVHVRTVRTYVNYHSFLSPAAYCVCPLSQHFKDRRFFLNHDAKIEFDYSIDRSIEKNYPPNNKNS